MFVLKIAEVMCFVLIDTGRGKSGKWMQVALLCAFGVLGSFLVVGKKNETKIVDALATRPRKNLLQKLLQINPKIEIIRISKQPLNQ